MNVNSVFKQRWQAQWNACPDNKLFQINPTVGDFYVWTCLSRREEIVITRMGHTYFTYSYLFNFIYLFGVLCRFQHCTGHITTGSWKGRGNQYIQFVRVLYCKLPTNGKQLPAFPLEAVPGIEPRPQRWEARVLPLCHRGPRYLFKGEDMPWPMSLPRYSDTYIIRLYLCDTRMKYYRDINTMKEFLIS